MFNHKGLCENELIDLCSEENVDRGASTYLYWCSEIYSFGKHYREYGFYPKFLPLCVYSDHGIDINDRIYIEDATSDAPHTFAFSKQKFEAYKKHTNKKCSRIVVPIIWNRRQHKIEQTANAKGTIAFPAHSTVESDSKFDVIEYITCLKNLPEDMQPVCVSLHMHDINKGFHKVFLEHGIPVYTAGNTNDIRFSERYYDILKHFKYATSNLIGSYTFYCVEMGIPFSLYGNDTDYFNYSNQNYKKLENLDYKTPHYLQAESLFKGINKSITKEQKDYVEDNICLHDSISRLECCWILYSSFIQKMTKRLWAMVNTLG